MSLCAFSELPQSQEGVSQFMHSTFRLVSMTNEMLRGCMWYSFLALVLFYVVRQCLTTLDRVFRLGSFFELSPSYPDPFYGIYYNDMTVSADLT